MHSDIQDKSSQSLPGVRDAGENLLTVQLCQPRPEKQRKTTSLIEAVLNCLIGIGVAFGMQVILFPMFGIYISLGTSGLIAVVFTGISIVRSYLLRRLFEWLRVSGVMP